MISKTEQIANLRIARARRAEAAAKAAHAGQPERGRDTKVTRKRHRTVPAASAEKHYGKARGARRGTKLELIVALLKQKGGCTAKTIMDVCHWPSVSVPQQARMAGLKLRKEKRGGVYHYWAA